MKNLKVVILALLISLTILNNNTVSTMNLGENAKDIINTKRENFRTKTRRIITDKLFKKNRSMNLKKN